MIEPHISDKKVYQDGKPLRVKARNDAAGVELTDWLDVMQDKNGTWYCFTGEYYLGIQRKQ